MTDAAATDTRAETRELQRIRLHLARSKDFPDGSARHGYEFVAPLDASGHIDAEAWKDVREACTVTRFWGNDTPESGYLVRRAGGVSGASWVFDYEQNASDDDETGYRFGDHAFAPGEYVSLRDEDGELHTFVVFSVVPA
ncbi:hypothetical protein FO470_03050 [Starkeya sp. 3C]|uniref:DUF5619 domain-containing protein n=1 Tax=Ancylobacter moscoviensis TaxID=2597768 RepID=A0ABY3DVB5_9HYPH|nr:hypothetical protein [Ancylobacter moscoviensis]TSJ64278.1 hypothetical protein FO470_03050 [Ancylobacter moscoviensis]